MHPSKPVDFIRGSRSSSKNSRFSSLISSDNHVFCRGVMPNVLVRIDSHILSRRVRVIGSIQRIQFIPICALCRIVFGK